MNFSSIKLLMLFCLSVVLLFSCENKKIHSLEDPRYVFDKNGRVWSYKKEAKPTFYQYNTLRALKDMLYHTPMGKIDSIITNNPDWQFVFYCKCQIQDSLELIELLNRRHCSFPVIIDSAATFLSKNGMQPYSEIGLFCDERGRKLGLYSSIGTDKSFFDIEFPKAKAMIRRR